MLIFQLDAEQRPLKTKPSCEKRGAVHAGGAPRAVEAVRTRAEAGGPSSAAPDGCDGKRHGMPCRD
ncbi:hypothetical protein Y5A_019560 [Burkholderia glumae AU6208]|nr:hypothetical protein Y5A_019560 [Burkholderia glumae AU6208]